MVLIGTRSKPIGPASVYAIVATSGITSKRLRRVVVESVSRSSGEARTVRLRYRHKGKRASASTDGRTISGKTPMRETCWI
jgi:hypothetical protein